jgi:hypothetical protein
MRDRLWLIILLLVWGGQWITGVSNLPPVQETPCWAVWLLVDDPAALVVYQTRGRALWPPPRSHSRRPHQRGGGKQPFRRPPACLSACVCLCVYARRQVPAQAGRQTRRVLTAGREEQEAQTEEAREVKSDSVLDPQRWGLSPALGQQLPERLHSFWERYAACFQTQTRLPVGRQATRACMPTTT